MELNKEIIIDAVRRAPPHGWKMGELATELRLDTKNTHRLRRLLGELHEDGKVERAPGARYRLPGAADGVPAAALRPPRPTAPGHRPAGPPQPQQPQQQQKEPFGPPPAGSKANVIGRIRVHPAGYGFVEREDKEPDAFVAARWRGTAMDGDKVRLTTWTGYKGTEGRVEEVLARGRAKLTGLLKVAGHTVYLEPDDPRIASTYGHIALPDGPGGGREGQCVVAEITRYPTGVGESGGALTARVMHVLGEADDPRTEVAKIIACADIPDTFPDDALAAAKQVHQELSPHDFADRIDLRDREFLTIDPETARDFDDAVCVEEAEGGKGYRVWIAVADVSHYVTPGNALDREARIRGCSVYLPDRAISMLPHELSSGICSLNPEVDRCAMVVRIDMDEAGIQRGDAAFCAAVIRSHARLDYPGVAAALSGDFRGARARYQRWSTNLERMNGLARKLRARRRVKGALDFDLPEAFVVLDEDDPGLVRDVRRSKANEEVKVAYQMIEEYMLAANEAVAHFFQERALDTVWRVHAPPSLERLEVFSDLAQGFGLDFEAERGQSPRVIAELLKDLQGKPYERALNFLLLRSLKQATYDVVNIGHFGLASAEYLHFTSPIRRYPDLIVHRLLKFHLRKMGQASGGREHKAPPPKDTLAAMALESSTHERRAASAEREVVDMYRTFLMRDRIGEELDGIISGVTNYGAFIECKEPFVEGLVKTEQLGDDNFYFDDKTMRLIGRRTGRVFALGDPVRVKVENVSVARRRIDMSLVSGGNLGGEVPVRTTPSRGDRPRGGPKGGRAPDRTQKKKERPGKRGDRTRNQDRDRGKRKGR